MNEQLNYAPSAAEMGSGSDDGNPYRDGAGIV